MINQQAGEEARWKEHYKNFGKSMHPPADTLLKALALIESEGMGEENRFAVDLGCGTGIDTLELLSRNWKVLAIDKQAEAIAALQSKVAPGWTNRLETQVISFEELTLPASHLINATFALPFCRPGHFADLWQLLTQSISVGGCFAGQLFGVHDDWSVNPAMTFHTAKQVKMLFDSFRIEFFEETERDGKTMSGQTKHWHVFHIVAIKTKN